MSIYESEYQSKKRTVEEALELIKTGDVIVHSECAIEPTTTLMKLHTVAPRATNLTVLAGMALHEFPFSCDEQYAEHFTCDCNFMMAGNRVSHERRQTSFNPGDLHNSATRWYEGHRPTVFIGQATPMDEHGYMCMSMCLIHEREAFEMADIVIMEVNPNVPRVFGDTEVHISQVDAIIEVNNPIVKLPASTNLTPEDIAIGQYIAELVNDGDTIQLGIGSIPDAAAQSLMTKHDLGVHTEMFTNSMVDLIEAGVLNGRKKSLHNGKMVGVFAFGEQRLYDLINDNPSIRMMKGSYVNNPYIFAQNDNMVSINTTLAVDLTGQCCSESIGSWEYSGTGGANDTALGANHSKGGRSIIAVRSTKKNGTISSITAQLPAGSYVSVTRANVDYIVTEYGIAPMRGRSMRERVNNLIGIAHPDFRAQLRADAEKFRIW
jgi:acyl-CoA hydrolase